MSSPAKTTSGHDAPARKRLRLFDCVCLIVGMVIGAGVWGTSGAIAASSGTIAAFVGLWLIGGLIALAGALCFAELATAYPFDGGTYVYLERAYGRRVAFVYAWSEFWLVRPANIGIMAAILAHHLRLWDAFKGIGSFWLASASIIGLAIINGLGLREGVRTQNVLTSSKLIAIVLVIGCGLFAVTVHRNDAVPVATVTTKTNWLLALLNIMFCFGGWNELGAIAAEVENPRRNLVISLLGGMVLITVVYLALQFSFMAGLGFTGMGAGESDTVAVDTLRHTIGERAGDALIIIICISCLGAINALLLTGSRVFAVAGGQSGAIGHWLARWDDERGVPYVSLFTQTAISIGLLGLLSLGASNDAQKELETLFLFCAPWYWGFLGLAGIALPLLRGGVGRAEGHFRTPYAPLFVAVFVLSSLGMGVSAIREMASDWLANRGWELPVSLAIMLAGIAAAWIAVDPRRTTHGNFTDESRRPSD